MARLSVPSVSDQGTAHEAGRPMFYASGTFANKWIRAEVSEVQKADGAPKAGDNDTNVLDPPPIARVRLYECTSNGVTLGEVDYRTLGQVQITCAVALSPRQAESLGATDPQPSSPGGQNVPPFLNTALDSQSTSTVDARAQVLQNFNVEAKGFDREQLGTWAVTAVVAPVPDAHTNVQIGLYCGFDDLKLRQSGLFAAHYKVFLYEFGDPVEPQRRFFSVAECYGAVFSNARQSPTLAQRRPKTPLTDHMERHGVISASPRSNSFRELPQPPSPSFSDPASSPKSTSSVSGPGLSLSGSSSGVASAATSLEAISDFELTLKESDNECGSPRLEPAECEYK